MALRAQLGALSTGLASPQPVIDPPAIRARLANWRCVLAGNPAEARRIVGTLLHGKLTFTPTRDGSREFYTFSGTGTLRGFSADGISTELPATVADTVKCPDHCTWRPQRALHSYQ